MFALFYLGPYHEAKRVTGFYRRGNSQPDVSGLPEGTGLFDLLVLFRSYPVHLWYCTGPTLDAYG